MKRILLSFASAPYHAAQRRLAESAKPYFDELLLYQEDGIGALHANYPKLMAEKRGYGYWCWKPFLIHGTLLRMEPGDVLFYMDSQEIVLADPAPLLSICALSDGVLLFHQRREGHTNRMWTKRDCFIKMGCDQRAYWDGDNINSGYSVWMRTHNAMRLVSEWGRWCFDDSRIVTDDPSRLAPELPEFRAHRHDQSILSLLGIRDSIHMVPDPSQFGVGYEMDTRGYGQIFDRNRVVQPPYRVPRLRPVRRTIHA